MTGMYNNEYSDVISSGIQTLSEFYSIDVSIDIDVSCTVNVSNGTSGGNHIFYVDFTLPGYFPVELGSYSNIEVKYVSVSPENYVNLHNKDSYTVLESSINSLYIASLSGTTSTGQLKLYVADIWSGSMSTTVTLTCNFQGYATLVAYKLVE